MWSISGKKIVRWLRIIHRDLGFMMVGICLIYGISGILLNHIKGNDPAFKKETVTVVLPENLEKESLLAEWKNRPELPEIKKVLPAEESKFRVTFQGGMGLYDSVTGEVNYEKNTKRVLVYWINKLHYNQVKGWHPMADFFAVSLIFFAVSGLFIAQGKKGIRGTGKWYLLIGLLIPALYILIS